MLESTTKVNPTVLIIWLLQVTFLLLSSTLIEHKSHISVRSYPHARDQFSWACLIEWSLWSLPVCDGIQERANGWMRSMWYFGDWTKLVYSLNALVLYIHTPTFWPISLLPCNATLSPTNLQLTSVRLLFDNNEPSRIERKSNGRFVLFMKESNSCVVEILCVNYQQFTTNYQCMRSVKSEDHQTAVSQCCQLSLTCA